MAKNPSPREERERTERERGGARIRERRFCSSWLARERKEKGEEVFKVPTQGSKIPSTQPRH